MVLNLETQQVDYINAISQVPLEQTVFVELSDGFEIPNKVLLLQKYAYGLKQSPLSFYKNLRNWSESRGFTRSHHDDCLFTSETVMILFWIDDCIFYVHSKKCIDTIILSLQDNFLMEREEDMAGFLGINILRDKDKNTITIA